MRHSSHIALLWLALMALPVLLWLVSLSWFLLDSTDYSIVHCLLPGLLLASALMVVFGSQWWVKQQLLPHQVDHLANGSFSYVARILRHQAAVLNVPPPVLHIYDSESLNAFIVGGIWHQQHLYLSEAIVTLLSRDELEAVIAHELAHVYHRDIVVNEVFFGMGIMSMYFLQHTLGKVVAYFVAEDKKVELAKKTAILLTYGVLLLPLWLMMVFYSRRSEYRADALASHLVGRQQFLWLLHRLRNVCRDSFFNLDGHQVLFRDYFTTHPSLHHRINALQVREQVSG